MKSANYDDDDNNKRRQKLYVQNVHEITDFPFSAMTQTHT